MPAPFRLYNTLTRATSEFEPLKPGHVSLYVCGMTVYARCHVGHARAMVVFDALVRYLRYRGWNVRFVRNFTDVDDKIIARAALSGESPGALAQRNIDAFHEDAAALGLIPPDAEPRVSTSIPGIQALIQTLIERGHAYAAAGSVWFDVSSFPAYGKLSGQKVDELAGSPDGDDGKRHPNDFALWKGAKPGEPEWASPWGPGRPGWHIECSAMSLAELGAEFDIHGGGLDLVFPHHENEVAQSECASGHGYARWWMHNGLLTMASGQKMGKSLGNVIDVADALAAFPSEALRLYYLQNHYRSPLPWSAEALPEALAMLSRLYEARELAEAMQGAEPAAVVAKELGPDAEAVLQLAADFETRFFAALDDDFNTAGALGHLFELVRAVNRLSNHKKAAKRAGPVVAGALAAFRVVSDALGLLRLDSAAFVEEVKAKRLAAMGLSREDVEARIAGRQKARQDKDWATADALRGELDALGVVVMDRADGVDWRIRL